MPRRVGSVLVAVVAAFAASLFEFTLTTLGSPAYAVADCIAAPEPPAPQGSHWYYRTDRATQRKCWYLGPQKVQNAASRAVTERQPAAEPVTPPITGSAAEWLTPLPRLEPGKAQAGPTMNAGETTAEVTPVVQWPDPPANTLERAAGGQEHARNGVQGSGALDERPVKQSVVAVGNIADFPTVS